MSARADYTAEEWQLIRRAPAEAVIAIEQASPSGFRGRRRERKAAATGFAAAISQFAGLGLVDALVAAQDDEGALVDALRSSGEPLIETAVETAGRARQIIETRGSREELEAFTATILGTCEAVARASGEHGEALNTSRAEAMLLRRLADALGRDDYEPPADPWMGDVPLHKGR